MTPVEGGAPVLNYTLDITVAPSGVAFPGAGWPWTNPSAAGANHALAPNVPATTTKQLAAMAAGLPAGSDIRKQHVHKTRVNAGGDGASGPHPERDPA
jgi:hypothetical protein